MWRFVGVALTAAVVGGVPVIDAQPAAESVGLSLAAARRLAVERSSEFVALRHELERDRALARQAGAYRNPVLSARREQTGGGADLFLEVAQPLDVVGFSSKQAAVARSQAAATAARLAAARADLEFEVIRVYLLAVAAERQVSLADRVVGSFDRATAISRKRREEGDISVFADRRLGLEAARVAANRTTLALARRSHHRQLGWLLADSTPFALTDSIALAPLDTPLDELVAFGLATRPEIRRRQHEAEGAIAGIGVANRGRWSLPVLSAGFKSEPAGRHAGLVVGLSVPVPVLDRGGAAVAAASADRDVAGARVDGERRLVVREIRAAWDGYQAVDEQRRLLAPRLGADAEAALRSAEVGFLEGEITLLEWLDTVRAYYEAESTLVDLTAESAIRRAEIERAVGRLGTDQ